MVSGKQQGAGRRGSVGLVLAQKTALSSLTVRRKPGTAISGSSLLLLSLSDIRRRVESGGPVCGLMSSSVFSISPDSHGIISANHCFQVLSRSTR